MKAGPCKEVFEVWQACVDGVLDASTDAAEAGASSADSRKEAATACADVTRPLFECMSLPQNREYYGEAMTGAPPPPPPSQEQGTGGADATATAPA
jgi:hypothetical protein